MEPPRWVHISSSEYLADPTEFYIISRDRLLQERKNLWFGKNILVSLFLAMPKISIVAYFTFTWQILKEAVLCISIYW